MPFSEDQLKELNELIAKAFGGDEFKKSLANTVRGIVVGVVRDSMKESIDKVDESVKALTDRVTAVETKPPAPDPQKKDGGKGGGTSPEVDALQQQLAKLQADVEKAQKATDAEKTKREEEHRRNLDLRRRNAFIAAANKVGYFDVDDLFGLESSKIQGGEDGKDSFSVTMKREWGDEAIPLEDYVTKELVQTERGKRYLPPAGGGAGGGGAPMPGAGPAGKGITPNQIIDAALSLA